MSKDNYRINVGIADKQQLFRKGLVALLSQNKELTIIADEGTSTAFLKSMKKFKGQSAVCIVDIEMPQGFQLLKELRKQHPTMKVLVLTNATSEYAVHLSIKLKASGYLPKSSTPTELLKAIRAIHTKGVYYSELATKSVFEEVQSGELQVTSLTQRQIDFLQYCLFGLRYEEIAQEMGVSPRTVDGYREGLFKKFNVSSKTDMVMYAVKTGILSNI